MDKDTQVYCTQGPSSLEPLSTGSLSGLRFVFKDLFNVEGYKTGAGNPKWLETHDKATATSPVIIQLLKQGASCAGRVQTDELAYSLNGQNIHYGTPINPVAPDCIPGGSSSGSAVAVARGDVDFAIGTDTGGSVRVPASYCGLYGLRPTLGLFDLSECFELSASFDTAGIFSQSLERLEQVYQALLPNPQRAEKVQQLYLDNRFLSYFSQARLSQLEKSCQEAGIELLFGDFLESGQWKLDQLSELFRTIQGYEIIQKHSDWLSEYGDSLAPPILDRVNWSRMITSAQYADAQAKQVLFKQQLSEHLQQNSFLWVIPTTPSGPPELTMDGEELAIYRSNLMGLTSIAGLSGFPQLHLPIHDLQEGPCGFSLMGQANQEQLLFVTGKMLQGDK